MTRESLESLLNSSESRRKSSCRLVKTWAWTLWRWVTLSSLKELLKITLKSLLTISRIQIIKTNLRNKKGMQSLSCSMDSHWWDPQWATSNYFNQKQLVSTTIIMIQDKLITLNKVLQKVDLTTIHAQDPNHLQESMIKKQAMTALFVWRNQLTLFLSRVVMHAFAKDVANWSKMYVHSAENLSPK